MLCFHAHHAPGILVNKYSQQIARKHLLEEGHEVYLKSTPVATTWNFKWKPVKGPQLTHVVKKNLFWSW